MASQTEDQLAAWIAAGRAQWPDVGGPDGPIAAILRGHLAHAAEVGFPADLFLAAAAAAARAPAIALVDGLMTRTASAVRGIVAPHQVDDIVQGLRERLLVAAPGRAPQITEYAGRAPLRGWLRVALIRAALDARRQSGRRAVREHAWLALPVVTADPALDGLRRRAAPAFREAFEAAFKRLARADQTLLRQHLLDGLSAPELARVHDVHRSTINRRITEAREALIGRLRAELQGRLGLSDGEVTTLLRAIRDDLDVSATRVLAGRRRR